MDIFKREKRNTITNNYRPSINSPIKLNFSKKINNSLIKSKHNQTYFEKIYDIYSSHVNLAENFKIIFFAFLPPNGLDNLNSIPDFINFRFSFWDFDEFNTPPCFVEKPEKYEINHLLTSPHLPIIQYNANEKSEEDAIIEINYDPSINNYISYRSFLSYLAFRELFVEIYDYEKKMPFGYFKFPLSKFLRPFQQNVSSEQIEIKVYDNFTNDIKGYIILDLKSRETKTKMPFNILMQNNILNFVETIEINSEIKNKKNIVNEMASKKRNILNYREKEEEKNYNKNIDRIKLSIIDNKTFLSQTNKYLKKNLEFYDYNEEKENNIQKEITNFNKKVNNLTLTLIQGEPHFFNFIIHNDSHIEQKYYINISSSDNKYSKNLNNDKILTFISNAEEWEYITMIKNLKIPNNYHSLSENGYFILGPNKTIPLLFKCLSYKSFTGFEKDFQTDHTAIIYDIKGSIRYCVKIKIKKVFPLVDFEFFYRIPKGTNKTIEFFNPYKYTSIIKSKQLLKNCVFINGNKNKYNAPIIEMNEKTNDFFFLFNYNSDFVDNTSMPITDKMSKSNKEYNSKLDLDILNNKKLLFLYKDKFGAQLLITYRFFIFEYEYISISYNFGTNMKNLLSITNTTEDIAKYKFFSSDNNIIYFDNKYKSGITTQKRNTYQMEYTLYLTKKTNNKEIQINCVDSKSREIYKAWIIKPIITKMNIIQTIDINFIKQINNDIKTNFMYTNPLNNLCSINFICSTKTVIDIPINQINFKANEKKNIIINIRKILIPQKITAYIFISDENNLFHQVIQININYL